MSADVTITIERVEGSGGRQWESQVRVGGALDVFRGSISAVLAALQVTLKELGA